MFEISFDPEKRQKTLHERNLDFADAVEVFEGQVYEIVDTRYDYGETRVMCFGVLRGRMVVIGYVQRSNTRHVFTMRKANEREQRKFKNRLG